MVLHTEDRVMRPLRLFISTTFLAVIAAQAGTAGTIPTLHNTGLNTQGAIDPYWTVNGSTAYVTAPNAVGFPFDWWVPDTSVSKWISPQPVYNANTDQSGTFTYSTTFDLTGFDPTTASITIFASADDWLTTVSLDKQAKATLAAIHNYGFDLAITISSGFQPGLNTLDFATYNIVQPNANPSGA